MNKTYARIGKRALTTVLAAVLAAGVAIQANPGKVSASEGIVFKTQTGGIFDGMPLFDGNPAHLDAFVDAYYDYIGLEGAALYATGIRDNYTFVMDDNPNKGKTVPGGLAAADNVYGVSTDFPALIGLGQSWNKDLVTQVGQVMGSEKISQLNVKQGTANIHNGPAANQSKPIAFTVLQDMRINPLNGRFPEGYGEDPVLSGTLIDGMAAGLAGTNQNVSDNGFWQRAVVGTKHFSVYSAEWFRQSASYNASARAIYEYQTPSAFKGLASGSVSGVMTSFGRTNGVPNIISPYMILGNHIARFGMYSSPDFNGENHLFNTSFSNGYDAQYTLDRKHALALMVLAHSESVRASGTDKTDVVTLANAVKEGLYGITLKDVQDAGRPLVNQLVRIGIFNEVDANGVPLNYPFANQAKDVSTSLTSFNTPAHQEVALQAARESVVLLKNNDGALPLAKNKKAAVLGVYADMRMKAQYSAGTTNLPTANKTPLYSILNTIGAGNVQYATGNEVVALKSQLNGNYLTAGSGTGSQLAANYAAGDNPLTDAQQFEIADWGLNAVSLQAKANGLWVTSPNANGASIGNTQSAALMLTGPDWSTLTSLGTNSTIPPKLRVEKNGDDTISLVANGLGFQTGAFSGRFVTTGQDGNVAAAASTIGNLSNFNDRSDAVKFKETVVKEAGADAAAMADTQDYALVFVGAHPSNSAAEGNDRPSLYLGENDYALVHKTAAAFAAKNKKTIVVVLSSSPVILKEIQNDPNVSAIVTQPYAGEFDAQGLTDVLFGDYAPTGRLTATWYADMSALPSIDSYSIPEGSTAITSLSQLDPRYTKDMFNADPAEAKLTYMYTNAPVTYPFGYGLGYADFTYKDFVAPATASQNGKFNVSVEVTNEGDLTTAEVVQLYAKKNGSSYDGSMPSKKLVAYEKVQLTAGEHKLVNLTVDPQDLAIWDVNRGDYIVENGSYTLMVGHSSEDIRFARTINIAGGQLASVKASDGFNVFDHSFASQSVAYREVSKARTVESLRAEKVAGEYYAVTSKGNGSWVAIPKADFTGAKKLTARVGTNGSGGNITLRADSPGGAPFASFAVPVTGKTTYTMPTAADQTVNELGYIDVEADVSQTPSGLHTVYVVFDAPDLRIDSLKASQTENVLTIVSPSSDALLTPGTAGSAYEQQLQLAAAGGTEPYAWSVTGLPEGLSFDSASNKIAGTPAAGTDASSPYTVTITVTDADGATAQVTDSLAIAPSASPEGVKAQLSGAANVSPGAAFSLTYALNSVTQAVYAQDIQIQYDPSLFEFAGADSLIDGVSVVGLKSDTPGLVRILLASQGSEHAVAADGNVLRLDWKAKPLTETRTGAFQIVSSILSDGVTETPAGTGTPIQVQITYTIPSVPGDLNGDGIVSLSDLALAAANYGKSDAKFDVTGDGVVDIQDLVFIARLILGN
ncbi:glycoside hydrolase family 3 C-terminal domain-containing protein [Cohnella candidum]|uniref:Carbohydrate-binding protein n=1 Tax=Cohnella candidum TaxID=2674991 RepID=A0A3G3K5F1_9BACL|nr:glycoside hydrolase family 3 C-terminal domain-containing protein [Cohnella candidum]AYQ75660.1 carbohydrate-binding protein [Cohnella candidum]